MKKTPLGPGSNQRGLIWRSYGEVMRPAYEDLIADRCVEAAAQPRDGCAADMMNWPGRVALRLVCPRAEAQRRIAPGVPSSEPTLGEQCSTPRPAHASGRRLSLVERRRESRARSVRPLRVGDGPSRFLGGKRWKKPETASIIARTAERMEGPGRGNQPHAPRSLTEMRPRCDRHWTEPSSSTVQQSGRGAATASAAPGSGPLRRFPATARVAGPADAGFPSSRETRPEAA